MTVAQASATPRVTAVMVTYNSKATLARALAGLRRVCDAGLCEAVVVDNASSDGTAEALRAEQSWLRVVTPGANLGFGRGNNRGLVHANREYVLLINPDADLGPDALREMVAFLDANPKVGIVGPAIREPGHPDQPAFRFPTPGTVVRAALGRFGGDRGQLGEPIEPRRYRVDWLCGAVLLVRRSLLQRLQGFDPRFFLYFEETDLCRRALAAGYETWVLGDVVAGHLGGASSRTVQRPMWDGCIAEHYFKSRYYYLTKHYGRLRAVAAELGELGLLTVVGALRRVCGKPAKGRVKLRWTAPILEMPDPIEDEPPLPEPAHPEETAAEV